jgi:hypothetical protein
MTPDRGGGDPVEIGLVTSLTDPGGNEVTRGIKRIRAG